MKTILLVLLTLTLIASAADPIDWQSVAVKNFPELGHEGSALHARFMRGVAQKEKDHPEFFKAANWPLVLARMASPASHRFACLGLTENEIRANYGPCDAVRVFAPASLMLRADKIDYTAEFEFVDGRCVRAQFSKSGADFAEDESRAMLEAASQLGWRRETDFVFTHSVGLGRPNNPGDPKPWKFDPQKHDLIARIVGTEMGVTTVSYEAVWNAESARIRAQNRRR